MSTRITFTSARNFREFTRGRAEGILDRRHVGAALQVQDSVAHAVFCAAHEQAAAGRTFGEIRGTQQARLVREKFQDLFPVPDVVASGDDFDATGKQIFGDPRRDAEARSGIFAVGDAEIDLALGEDVREPVVNDFAAGRAHDVADE